MSETIMSDEFPDRLSVDPNSPYYNADILARDVGIRFKGAEKTNVEEYCISEGWVRVTAGNANAQGGDINIKSGDSETATSGSISLATPDAVASGDVAITTGGAARGGSASGDRGGDASSR